MCCGRGIKKAATQQYAPLKSISKVKMTAKEKANSEYPTYHPPGAFYGNPVKKSKAKKPDVVPVVVGSPEQEEALDLVSKAPVDFTKE